MDKKKALYVAALVGAFYVGHKMGVDGTHETISVRYLDAEANIVSPEQVKRNIVRYINHLPDAEKRVTIDELIETSDNDTLTNFADQAIDSMDAYSNRYIGNRAYSNYFSKKVESLQKWIRNLI